MDIRLARIEDFEALAAMDSHLRPKTLMVCISLERVLVAEENGVPKGLLRWNFFWDTIPFCNLLWVAEECRGKGIGSALLAAWEESRLAEGDPLLMTSTQADETAQFFYRKRGYVVTGGFLPQGETYELLLEKRLTAAKETKEENA